MLKCLECINWKKTGIFAAGVAFGTAGIKILSSKDAKKVYTNCTAAVLRAKECVMKTVSTVQENADCSIFQSQIWFFLTIWMKGIAISSFSKQIKWSDHNNAGVIQKIKTARPRS